MAYIIVILGAVVFLSVGLYCIKKADKFFEGTRQITNKSFEQEESTVIPEPKDTGAINIGVLTQKSSTGIEMKYDVFLIPKSGI